MDIYNETNNYRYTIQLNFIQIFKHVEYHINIIYFYNIPSRYLHRYLYADIYIASYSI